MQLSIKHTTMASYIGYIVQAIVNTFMPLLYAMFNTKLHISYTNLGIIAVINFVVQIATDFSATLFVPKLGYRKSIMLAHFLSFTGLILLGILPMVFKSAFVGLIISTVFMAVGGGLIEVIVSPLVEALPNEKKEKSMAFLHSFYCWGQMIVVLVSTLFFKIFSIEIWYILPFVWALVPLFNIFYFSKVPIYSLPNDNSKSKNLSVLKNATFYIFLFMMLSAGASELAMSTWVSTFAEMGLNVDKTTGDLLGPCLFALFMGVGRLITGLLTTKINVEKCLLICSIFCVLCYVGAVFILSPIMSLICCALTGLFVSLFWPGTLSSGAKHLVTGGTFMFSMFALFGDIGCTLGSSIVGFISDLVKNGSLTFITSILPSGLSMESLGIRAGLLICAIFPLINVICTILLTTKKKKRTEK